METILITGGAGFIGSHVCDNLVDRGFNVLCLDNLDSYYNSSYKRKNILHNLNKRNFKLVDIDIRDKDKLENLFKTAEIDKVVHLAARPGVRPSIEDPYIYTDININGTISLLELSRKHAIKNFVFASSSSVYGISNDVPFKETTPAKPISPYAASKKSAEMFCHVYAHLYNMPITCLRFFTVYGPRGRPDMAVYKFTKLIDQGKAIPVFGDGSSRRDYTYVSDTVQGIVNAIDKRFKFKIFNLGNSRTVELRYLISLIEKELGKKAKIKRLGDQPGDVAITYANISRAKGLLGYDPKVPIEEGIKRFVKWYKTGEATIE